MFLVAYESNGTRNCMVLMALSPWNNGGKKQRGTRLYQAIIGNVSQTESVVLHHARIDEILKWTKEHLLDAYLASADVILDQRDKPG